MQPSRDNRGFTLIEVLVSVVLLAVVVTAVFELYSRGFKSLTKTETALQAVILAEGALEEALAHRDTLSAEGGDIAEGFDLDVNTTETQDSPVVFFTVEVRYKDRLKIKLTSAGLFYEQQ